jgi:hypothetical protein
VRLKKAEIRYRKRRLPRRTFEPFVRKSMETTLRIRTVKSTILTIKIT